MAKLNTKLTLSAVNKKFKNKPTEQPLLEYLWNGLDHFASEIKIRFDFDNFDFVEVMDNGDGIEKKSLEVTFSPWDSTTKKSINQKGKNGSGRYSYVKLSDRAVWYTRHKKEQQNYLIKNDIGEIDTFHTEDIEQNHAYLEGKTSGTVVRLTDLKTKLKKFPTLNSITNEIKKNCSWKLAINPALKIFLNGEKVEALPHKRESFKYKFKGKSTSADFDIELIQWSSKPVDELCQSYFINSNNHLIHRETNTANNKIDFYISVVVKGAWIDNFQPDYLEAENQDGLFLGSINGLNSEVYKGLKRFIDDLVRDKYYEFLVSNAKFKISEFKHKGYFPERKNLDVNYSKYLDRRLEQVIEDIYIVEPRFFTNLSLKQGKLIFAILDKLTVSNHNEDLIDVLEGIMDLSDDRVKSLANVLRRTRLDNIVDTVNTLTGRLDAVSQLRHLILHHPYEVLETPDLQGIIANNTWLFGDEFTTIGNEEDDFTSVVRNLIKQKVEGVEITEQCVEDGKHIEGVKRQVDFFLLDTIKREDYATKKHYFKCTIIEIKRPGVSLNKHHMRQLSDYIEIVQNHPAFKNNPLLQFEFILVGRKISNSDTQINNAFSAMASHNQPGLVAKADRINGYVYTWEHILNEYELSNSHLIEILNLEKQKIIDETAAQQVEKLQKRH